MKLWEYESGRKLQSLDLSELEVTTSSDKEKVTTVLHPTPLRPTSCPKSILYTSSKQVLKELSEVLHTCWVL